MFPMVSHVKPQDKDPQKILKKPQASYILINSCTCTI